MHCVLKIWVLYLINNLIYIINIINLINNDGFKNEGLKRLSFQKH